MAKKQTKDTHTVSACEQYVVEELKQAKKEIEQLEKDFRNLQRFRELENKEHDRFVELVKKALLNAEVKEMEQPFGTLVSIYINDNFLTLYNRQHIEKKEESLVALVSLIKLVQRIPERE